MLRASRFLACLHDPTSQITRVLPGRPHDFQMKALIPSRLAPWVFLFLLAAFLPARLGADCTPLQPSARHWFRFENDFVDHLRGGIGTPAPGTVIGAGRVGSGGLELTAPGAGLFINPGLWAFSTTGFTLEGWVKRASRTSVSWDGEGIFFAGTTNGIAFGILPDGRLFMGRAGGTRVTSLGNIIDEGWHHVAAAFDTWSIHFYIDGAYAGGGEHRVGFGPSTSYAIGRFPAPINGLDATFAGTLDEWTVHNAMIGQEEIQSVRASGSEGRCLRRFDLGFEPLPDSVRTNSPFEFQVTIGNRSQSDGIARSVTIPTTPGIRFESATATRGTFNLVEGRIEWLVPGIPPGNQASLIVRASTTGAAGDHSLQALVGSSPLPVAETRLRVIDECGATPGTSGDCPRNLTVDAPELLHSDLLPVISIVPFSVRVRNPSAGLVAGARLTLRSPPGQPIAEVTAPGAKVVPIADGFRVEFDDLVPGAVRSVSVRPWTGPTPGEIRCLVEAPDLVPEAADSRRRATTRYQLSPGCNPAPQDTAFWMPTRFDLAEQMGDLVVRSEGIVTPMGNGFRTGLGAAVVDGPSLFGGTAVTVQAWILPETSAGFVDVLFAHESPSPGGVRLNYALGIRGPREPSVGAREGQLMVRYRDGEGLPDEGGRWTDTGVSLPLRQWAHVAIGHDGRRLRVWLNGRLASEFTTLPSGPDFSTGTFRLGGRDPVFTPVEGRFNGLIRQVLATTRLLETVEVANARLATLFGLCPADASVSWTTSPGTSPLGVPFRMEWRVTNSGPFALEGVRVEADIPPGWEVQDLRNSSGTIRREGDRIIADAATLARGTPVSLGATLRATTPFDGELTARVIADQPAEMTLDNNAAATRLRITGPVLIPTASAAVEGPPGARTQLRVNIALTHPLPEEVRVDYRVEPLPPDSGSQAAAAGTDFEPTSGTLVFPPGVATTQLLVTVLGDDSTETTETFRLVLENPTAGAVAGSPLLLTIIDDDAPSSVRVRDAVVTEGNTAGSVLSFGVRLSKAVQDPVRLGWRIEPGTAEAGADHEGTTGVIEIPAGEVAATIRIPVVADTVAEPTEYLRLVLEMSGQTQAGLRIEEGSAIGTILDDDAPPGAVARFEIVAPTDPIAPGSLFPVEIRAVDAAGRTATGFQGTVDLSAVPLGRPTDPGLPSSLVIGEVHPPDPTATLIGAELWNVTPARLDLTGWRFSLYTQQSWPLPATNWAFPKGASLRAGEYLFIEPAPGFGGGSPGGSFRIGPPKWGATSPAPRVEDQRFAVLVQDPSGRVVDFLSSGGGSPSEIHVPVSLAASQWMEPLRPGVLRTGFAIPVIHQRSGNSQVRDPSGWFLGLGEYLNRYLRTPFIDAQVQPTVPATSAAFVEGVWRGEISIPAPRRWMSLFVQGADGATGVRAPLKFDLPGDLAILSHEVSANVVGGGRLFRQRLVVTNGAPSAATRVTLRLIPPPSLGFGFYRDFILRLSQGTNRFVLLPNSDEYSLVADLGTLPPHSTAVIELERPELAFGTRGISATLEARWVAELESAEPDPDPTNNRTERSAEIAHAPALPATNRIAWLPGEGDSTDRLGRLRTSAENVAFSNRLDRQAFRFDGTARIRIDPDPAFRIAPDNTHLLLVQFWFRSTDSSRPRMTLLSVPESANGTGWSLDLVDGRPVVRLGYTDYVPPPGLDLCNGEWHFLAFLVGPPSGPQRLSAPRSGLVTLTNTVPAPDLQTVFGQDRPAFLGGSPGGFPLVGELDEVVFSLLRKDVPVTADTLSSLRQAGALGTAEGVIELSDLRRGPGPNRPPMIVGRPYTLTLGVRNSGTVMTGPLVGFGTHHLPSGIVTEAFWNGAALPVDPAFAGRSVRLPPLAPGGTGELSIVVLPIAEGSASPRVRIEGALRDSIGQIDLNSTVIADTDADGLPSAWETTHGLNPASRDDASLDSDGDGYSNRAEFDAGTLPRDANSHPRAEWTLTEDSRLRVRFGTTSDRDYQLEWTPSLETAQAGGTIWQVLRKASGTGGMIEMEANPPVPSPQGFYRLRILPLW